jgi:hypothetical protein
MTALAVHKKKVFAVLAVLFWAAAGLYAQTAPNDTLLVQAIVYEGDTIEARVIDPVYFFSKANEATMTDKAKWTRLRNAVYVTFPYAKRAGMVMNDINNRLPAFSGKTARRDYIKSREKELKKEFADPLTNLSVYQGKVLMKLINRETHNNCYELIKEYKGGFTARFWQTVAFFFGSNLKQPYDANGEDKEMEKIVQEVERMYGYRS